jgi:hypothetical protein
LSQETAEALGIGYAPKGIMHERLRRYSYQAPDRQLTGYIGKMEAKLPKEFHLSNVVTFPKKTA